MKLIHTHTYTHKMKSQENIQLEVFCIHREQLQLEIKDLFRRCEECSGSMGNIFAISCDVSK